MEFNGIIYCYTNKLNNKKYVGQTIEKNYKRRHYRHRVGDVKNETAFSRAIKKYGYDNFILEIIESNIPTNEILDEAECKYIKLLNSKVPYGYNLTDGGHGRRGYTVPLEQKMHLMGKNNHNYGKPMPENVKNALKEANSRPEVREAFIKMVKISSRARSGKNNHNYGKPLSEERKAKLAKAHTEKLSGANNPSARAVVCIETGECFLTMKDTIKFTGLIGYCNISGVCRGKLKSYGGYTWRYATIEEIEKKKQALLVNI